MPIPAESPRIFTVPPGADFLGHLARWLTAEPNSGDPLALADALVLLPTRRAARSFADRLAGLHDAPVVLPRIRALGDVDLADLALDVDAARVFPDPLDAAEPLPRAIGDTERQLILARLIEAWGQTSATKLLTLEAEEAPLIPGSPAMAARLAAELARLMDAIETEGLDYSGLETIVPDGFARYWQIALDFLTIVSDTWPAILQARGLVSPAALRNALIEEEAARLSRVRPETPIIAAGSTGSIPATAHLLNVVARLPKGAVVLPGLDTQASDADWVEILASPSHPQHGMARLLQGMTANRTGIAPLPGTGPTSVAQARTQIARLALQPAASTDQWAAAAPETADIARAAAEGLSYVCARTVEEEALAIALVLRKCADDPECTAALVTPDRVLARRVASELRRWTIDIDDSAGVPLASTPPGAFARHAAALMTDGLEPVPLLALLKHPLAGLGMARDAVRRAARTLEIAVLRGPRPEPTVAGLRRALALAATRIAKREERSPARGRLTPDALAGAERVLAALEKILGSLPAADGSLASTSARHARFCEALAADETGSTAALYAGPAGMALATLFADMASADTSSWPVRADDYPPLAAALMAGRPVRPRRPAHPNLSILGLLEARLIHADLIILGGLNEGTWPAETRTDPWLSRPMRAQFGLPAPERRIGLAAHDFAQAFAAPRVVLTRAERVDGDPSVESRWLRRLDAVLIPHGGLAALRNDGDDWLRLARKLDETENWMPASPPGPKPPVGLRPRRLSVTEIETWNRDPYAIYARHVLRLDPLDGLDEALDAATRGTVIHDALSELFRRGEADGPANEIEAALVAIGGELFAALPDAPEVKAFWKRRFARAGRWFAQWHESERGEIAKTLTELSGSMEIDAPGGAFVLRARADRIDVRDEGLMVIIDYKTGMMPGKKEVTTGLAPQLSLEAAMARAGAFGADLAPGPVGALTYVQLSGGTPPGDLRTIDDEPPEALAAHALAGLTQKIARFDEEDTPYLSRPHVKFASRFAPYDHLARVREWSRQTGEGGE